MCANAAVCVRPRHRRVHQDVDDVAVCPPPPLPFLNVLSTLATLPVNVAHFVLAGGVSEARVASVESAHLIVNHKLSAGGCGTFSDLTSEENMRFGGKMHIKFGGKMHIRFGGKMH